MCRDNHPSASKQFKTNTWFASLFSSSSPHPLHEEHTSVIANHHRDSFFEFQFCSSLYSISIFFQAIACEMHGIGLNKSNGIGAKTTSHFFYFQFLTHHFLFIAIRLNQSNGIGATLLHVLDLIGTIITNPDCV